MALSEERLHEVEVKVSILEGQMEGLSQLPEKVTELRISVASLQTKLAIGGTIITVVMPVLTALVLHFLGLNGAVDKP